MTKQERGKGWGGSPKYSMFLGDLQTADLNEAGFVVRFLWYVCFVFLIVQGIESETSSKQELYHCYWLVP